jgi:integrase
VRSKQEGTIYQRPDGAWRAQVTVRGKRISYTGKSQRDCREWLHKVKVQINQGLTYDSAKVSVAKYAKSWLFTIEHSIKEGTWRHYQLLVNNHIIPFLGKRKMFELTTDHVQQFYDHMIKQDIGVHTILKTHAVLTSMLNQATRFGLITRNPAQFTVRPKIPHKEMQIFDEGQVSYLLASTRNTKWYALFHMAISTGMRQMELLGLQWSDIDWLRMTVSVERQLKRSNKVEFAPTKTRQSKRTIEIGQQTIQALREHQEIQNQWRRDYPWTEYNLIFTSYNGTPVNHRNLLRDFKALLMELKLPLIRFHDLRHTSASLMLSHNIPVNIVSKRLGHARPSITLDVYSHLIPSQQEEVARLIDDIITPIPVNVKENSSGN